MTPTILAVGASGKFAGLVLPELAKRGAKVRGLIRNASEAGEVRRHGASETAVGDLRDRTSLDAALLGIEAVFYILPATLPNEVEVGHGMVDAAKAAGVRRFVFSSLIHPVLGALSHHITKAAIEEAVLASDMEFTFLHPAVFFQDITAAQLADVRTSGVFSEPWSTGTRFSRVDYRDVAEVAAIALTEERLNYGTFELCADGHPDRHDLAALMAAVLGRKVKATRLSPPASPKPPAGSNAEKEALKMAAMFDWYDRHGLVGNPLILHAILGRPPRTLGAYLEELAAEAPPVVERAQLRRLA